MNNKIKYVILIFGILVIGWLGFLNRHLFFGQDNISVGLKWKHQAQFAGMYVADTKGFYKKLGLNVDFREFDVNTSQLDDLMSQKSDIALISAEEFLLAINEGQDIKAIASIYQTSPYVIATLADSGIKTPADFVGKVLGVKGGKLEEKLFYLLLLKEFGIPLENVTIKELGFDKKEVDDLLDGDADVVGLYRTDQLYYFNQKNIDYNLIYPENFGININNDILVAKSKFIDTNPDIIKNFLTATAKGWEYAAQNQDEAIIITMKYVTDDNYRNEDYERYILSNSLPLIKPGTNYEIGRIKPQVFEKLYTSMKGNKFLTTDFIIGNFYTNQFNER